MNDNEFHDIERADAVAWIMCLTLGIALGVTVFCAAVTA